MDHLEAIAEHLRFMYVPVEIGHRSGERGVIQKATRLLRDYRHFRQALQSATRSGVPVTVHINSSVQHASLFRDLGFALIARVSRVDRQLVQIHGCELSGPTDPKPILRQLARLLALVSGRIVLLSASQLEAVGGAASPRGAVIHNSIQMQEPVFRQERDDSCGPIRVLFLARVVVEKGILNCLEAIALLRDAGTRVKLTVAGEGPLLGHLRARIEKLAIGDRVDVRGPVAASQVRTLMAAHDILWAPSLSAEGQPYSMIEALEAGMPILATASSPAMQEMIELSGGAVVKVLPSAEDLAAKTASLIQNPDLLRRLQIRARMVAEREYSVEAMLQQWKDAWSVGRPGFDYPGAMSSPK
jgi:glycosyltransferase involved in cell wall biosynthesis